MKNSGNGALLALLGLAASGIAYLAKKRSKENDTSFMTGAGDVIYDGLTSFGEAVGAQVSEQLKNQSDEWIIAEYNKESDNTQKMRLLQREMKRRGLL